MKKYQTMFSIMLLSIAILCIGSCTKKNEIEKPMVETVQVIDITENSATGRGIVKSDGGDNITERGICWSIEHNPTISSNHVSAGEGLGEFTCSLTQLEPNTTYFLRAYAINSVGEAYGNEIAFSTIENNNIITLPTIKLRAVEDITDVSAVCYLELVNNGGTDIIDCGICWSEEPDPLLNNNHESLGAIEAGDFSCEMRCLTPETTYFVRAYATNGLGTSYSSGICFTTPPTPLPYPIGAINGLFSVSGDMKVFFSQGNLQYQASSNIWRFAEHQWDYVGSTVVESGNPGGTVNGSSNHLVSSTYNGWIDLYYWGTSGIDDYTPRANCYQPWSTDNHYMNYFAYGSLGYGLFSQSGKADWGYNAISNGGNSMNQWRTLKKEEWEYVINTRDTPSGIRYAKAQVNGVNGLILLPDSWADSIFVLNDFNQSHADFNSNVITPIAWETMELNGAVFLPAAGGRSGTNVESVGEDGSYWSSSHTNTSGTGAGVLAFKDSWVFVSSGFRYGGRSVRLVSKQ